MPAADSFLTTWEIRERSGGPQRFTARLYGRAVPYKDAAMTFGVLPRAERTLDHGSQTKRTEALGVDWEPLVLTGHWKQNFLDTGDARVQVEPARRADTPQAICDFFEIFASRQRELEVVWSGGVTRLCDWDGFSYTPTVGPDRRWTMRFVVLGRGARAASSAAAFDGRSSIAAMSASHLSLDRLLAQMPDGFEPTFLDRLRGATDSVRTSLARMRLAMQTAGDLARAPADALRELNNLAASTRDLITSTRDVFEETAYEYQLQTTRSEDMLRAARWRGDIHGALDTNLDAILAILDAMDARLSGVERYVAVVPGESLVRVAQRAYGSSADWRKIADANGITGQIVPSGVTRLVIPPPGN